MHQPTSYESTLQEHPGGAKIILKYAGRDATTAYEPIHPPDALDKNLPPEKHLGELNIAGTAALQKERETRKKTKDEIRVEQAQARKPRIDRMLSLRDLEVRTVHLRGFGRLLTGVRTLP